MNIIILGPQGSGKGTQAQLLGKKLRLPTISAGELLRGEAKKKSALGRKIKSIIDRGILAPDSITLSLILKRIRKKDCRKGFILDGYPRNKKQLHDTKRHIKVGAVLRINISEKESVKRLSSRRQCRKCGAIYNLLTKKPKRAGVCDKCGSVLVQRADDRPAAIRKRLAIYRRESKPVYGYFGKKKLLLDINGGQGIQKVHRDILKNLKTA